jgi:hypothetical protein
VKRLAPPRFDPSPPLRTHDPYLLMPDTAERRAVAVAPSLRALLDQILDYAGLFPPAALSLDEAIRRYARYRRAPEAWMLARFVLPAARLPELDAYAGLFADEPPFRFAVLGTGGPDPAAFGDALDADLRAVAAFLERYPAHVQADVLEVRLPPALPLADAGALEAFFGDTTGRITAAGLPRLDVFFEAPLSDALRPALPVLLDVLAGRRGGTPQVEMGLKVRTGGLEPAAFPDAGLLAAVIAACRDHGVRFKATAGLHHPVRRYDAAVQAPMYGFLNVFGAAALAAAHGLDAPALRTVLLDEDPDHFRFTPDAFAWNGLSVPAAAIRRTRSELAVSFGSCSFDEPREDLAALGLL